jgi:hypothetical protein
MFSLLARFAASSGAALALWSATAVQAAIPVAPVGPTVVVLTATPTLVGAGVSVAPLGSATAFADASGNLVGAFSITGGMLDPDLGNATIEHDGSGLRLSTSAGSIDLENFVIDTTLPIDTISGRVSFGSTVLNGVGLFALSGGSQLVLTEAAGDALAAVLGIPDLGGATVGFALTNPLPVPEPGTYAMMAAGLGLLALANGRRSSRRARIAA